MSRAIHAASIVLPLLAALTVAPLEKSAAQDPFDAKSAAHVRDAYFDDMDSVHVKIVALAKAIPPEKYSWRPTAGVRTVSEVLMHVVGEWYFYGPRSIAGKEPSDFGVPKDKLPALEKIAGKPAVLAELDKSWAYFKAQVKASDAAQLTGKYKPWGTTIDEAAFGMTGDQHEHLGQLIAYARSVGVKPPWTK